MRELRPTATETATGPDNEDQGEAELDNLPRSRPRTSPARAQTQVRKSVAVMTILSIALPSHIPSTDFQAKPRCVAEVSGDKWLGRYGHVWKLIEAMLAVFVF